MDREELIRGYFNQLLTKEQEIEYSQLYDSDEAFRTEAKQAEIEILGIRQASRQEVKSKFSDWEEEMKNGQAHFSSKSYLPIGIAASIVLMLGFGLFFFQQRQGPAFDNYYEVYSNYEYTTTRADIAAHSIKARAYKAYDDKQYFEALALFNEHLSKERQDYPSIFFRGLCHMEARNYPAASADFQTVYNNSKTYQSGAYWYGALALLALDDQNKAGVLLKNILTDDEFGDRANALKEELNP